MYEKVNSVPLRERPEEMNIQEDLMVTNTFTPLTLPKNRHRKAFQVKRILLLYLNLNQSTGLSRR